MRISLAAQCFLLLSCIILFSECMRVVHLPRIKANTKRPKRSAVGPIWPQKSIPYAFSNIMEFDFEARALIKQALKEIEESLGINGENCIQFKDRSQEKDFILFVNRGDCSSGIGYFPGVNNISLAENCLTSGTIIHEVMHRLGFDHEHSRPDRDQNIKVLLENMEDTHNFKLNPNSKVEMDAPYDYHSVIHYNSNAFNKDQHSPTILSKQAALVSDQNEINHDRKKLSPIDIYKIQSLYKCQTLTIPSIIKKLT